MIGTQQIGKVSDCSIGTRAQPVLAIKQVLRSVKCRVAYKRLWVDDEPLPALRAENVACVKIGCQQCLYRYRPGMVTDIRELVI